MQTLRPFQIAVIAVFVVAALGGLYVFTTFRGGSNTAEVGTVVIWGTLPQASVDAALVTLTSGNDRYGGVSYMERSEATFGSDLSDAIASGVGPDLVLINQESLLAEKSKLTEVPFATLPQRTFVDSYLPIFELFLTPSGSYGIPMLVDPLVLYYNRTILSSEGIAGPPLTWEAVSGLALTLTKRDGAGTISRSLIPMGEYQNVTNARALLSLLLLQAGTPITTNTGAGVQATLVGESETSFGSTPAESAVAFYAQFADPAKTVYSWNRSLGASRMTFITGDLVLYPGYASERASLSAANPNLDFDMTALPQPGVNPIKIGYAKAYAFAIPKASPNPTGALAAAFALSDDAPMAAAASAVSMAPAKRALLNAPADDRYASVVYGQALLSKAWLSPAPYVTDAIFSAMMSDVLTGRLTLTEALVKAEQSLNAVLP